MVDEHAQEPTFQELLVRAGFSETEIEATLDTISKEVIGSVIAQVEAAFPHEVVDELSTLSVEERVKRVFELAPEYVSQEEVQEIEAETRQQLVEKFCREVVRPRLPKIDQE